MDLATCQKKLDKVPALVLAQTKTVALEAVMLGTYFAVLFAAIAFSTPRLRASWALRCQFVALALAFVMFGLDYQMFVYNKDELNLPPGILRDYHQTQVSVASSTFQMLIPWVVDLALLLKLISLFPSWSATPRKRAMMLAFPVLTLVPRFVLLVLFGARAMLGWNDPGSGPFRTEVIIYYIVFLGLQVAQNIYCSVILVNKAHRYFAVDCARSASVLHARLRLRFYLESFLFSYIATTLISLANFVLNIIRQTTTDTRSSQSASRNLGALQILFAIHFGFLTIFWQSWRGSPVGLTSASRGSEDERLHRRSAGPGFSSQMVDPKDRTLLSVLAVDEIPHGDKSENMEQLGSEIPDDPEWAEKLRDRWRSS